LCQQQSGDYDCDSDKLSECEWFVEDIPGKNGCKDRDDVDEDIYAIDSQSFDTVGIEDESDTGGED
jgi:hypothetical protein